MREVSGQIFSPVAGWDMNVFSESIFQPGSRPMRKVRRSAELKSFFQGFKSFSEFWVTNDAQYGPSVPLEAILGDETMISYVLWNKNMMQELILVRNSLFLIFYEIRHQIGYEIGYEIRHEIRHRIGYEKKQNWDKIMNVCLLVVKQILGRL